MWSPLLLARWWFSNGHVTPEVETFEVASGKCVFFPKKAIEEEAVLLLLLMLLCLGMTLGMAATILIPT